MSGKTTGTCKRCRRSVEVATSLHANFAVRKFAPINRGMERQKALSPCTFERNRNTTGEMQNDMFRYAPLHHKILI